MTLRTASIPNPAVGEDWTAVVPGQYVYDVAGITATLDTGNGAPATIIDHSGAGNDGTVPFATDTLYGVPGIITGDDCIASTGNAQYGSVPLTPGFLAGDYSDALWVDIPANHDITCLCVQMSNAIDGLIWEWDFTISGGLLHFSTRLLMGVSPGVFRFQTASAPIPATGPHMFAITVDSGTGGATFYIDGTAHVGIGFAFGAPTSDPDTAIVVQLVVSETCRIDEQSWWPTLLDATDVALLYAAGLADHATYAAQVLMQAATGYYWLDEFVPGGPRQVDLQTTNGNNIVGEFPTGFAPPAGNGPFGYSWQPRIPTSSQTPDGTLTTVAIPRLILPAGYTVGSNTLDLAGADQWSNVVIWWDDAFMLSLADVTPYVYPPGVKLVYRPQGAT